MFKSFRGMYDLQIYGEAVKILGWGGTEDKKKVQGFPCDLSEANMRVGLQKTDNYDLDSKPRWKIRLAAIALLPMTQNFVFIIDLLNLPKLAMATVVDL